MVIYQNKLVLNCHVKKEVSAATGNTSPAFGPGRTAGTAIGTGTFKGNIHYH